MSSDITGMLVELAETQASAEDLRTEMRERVFQRANDIRAMGQRWDDAGPHTASDTEEYRVLIDAGRSVVAKAVTIIKENNVLRSERSAKLVKFARKLEQSGDRDPEPLLNEMIAVSRRELEIDLPSISAAINEMDRRVLELETFVESFPRSVDHGHVPKLFGRKNDR